jgi:hypothetical protein
MGEAVPESESAWLCPFLAYGHIAIIKMPSPGQQCQEKAYYGQDDGCADIALRGVVAFIVTRVLSEVPPATMIPFPQVRDIA